MKRVWAIIVLALAFSIGVTDAPANAAPAGTASTWLTGSIYLSSGSAGHMGVVSVWRSPLRYDIVLNPGQSSSSWRADVDGFYIGPGWNADVYQCFAAYQCDSHTWNPRGNVGAGFHTIPSGRAVMMITTHQNGSWKAPTKANAVPASFTKPATAAAGNVWITNYGSQVFGVKRGLSTNPRYDVLLGTAPYRTTIYTRTDSYVVTGPTPGGWCAGFRYGPTGGFQWISRQSDVWSRVGPYLAGQNVYVWVIHRYGGTCASAAARAAATA